MFCIYPLCADDRWYMAGVDGGAWSLSALASAVDYVEHLWHTTNGRVGNLAAALFLGFMPRGVWAVLMALCCLGIMALGPRVVRCRPGSVASAAWVAGFCFLFPWLDYMFSIMYSLNYLPALLLGLATFALYERGYDGREPARSAVAGFLAAWGAAWWHEGLAVPLGASLVVYSLVRRQRLPRPCAAILGGVALGAACIALSPAFWNSMDFREPIWNRGTLSWRLLHLLGFNCLFFLYLAAIVVVLAFRATRRRLVASRVHLARQLALLAFGLVTLPIYVKYYAGPRTGAFSQMFSLAGLLSLGRIYLPRPLPRRVALVAWALLFGACLASLAASIAVQRRLSAEIERVDAMWRSPASQARGAVFFDVTRPAAGLDLFRPSYQVLNTSYGLDGRTILPARLEHFDSRRHGTACSDTMLLLYDGLVVYRDAWDMGPARTRRPDIVIVTAAGDSIESRADWYSFRDTAGAPCTYVAVHAAIMNPSLEIADARRTTPAR